MEKNKSKTIVDYIVESIVYLCKRSIALYVVAFFLFQGIVDHDRAKLLRLNRLIPSFETLVEFIETPQSLTQKDLTKYMVYYKKVTEYIPNRADAFSMLGFCYYYSGDVDRAITTYKKAVALNPRVFWFHYNLGIIYLHRKQYDDAMQSFKLALETNPKNTIVFLRVSKIYQDLLRTEPGLSKKLERTLKSAYQDSQKLFLLSTHYSSHPPEGQVPVFDALNLKIL